MRREFILILLGIISTSTFSSLLSSYYQTETDNVLLDTVVGVVGAGNFSYWHLGHTGSLKIVLNSIKGDADLYVAENTRPTYDIHRNNYSSATCGVDVVDIPAEFPRPIGIGVFGYWSSAVSEYNIQIFLDNNPPYVKPLPEEAHQKVSYQGNSAGLQGNDNQRRVDYCRFILITDIDDGEFLRSILWTDESKFTREGIENFHNQHYWTQKDENPRLVRATSYQTKFSVNVWAGVIGNKIIGPHYLPDNLNGSNYLEFLQNDLPDLCNDIPIFEEDRPIVFQQDGCPAHYTLAVREHLNNCFPNSWIGRGGPIEWPARSPDLTPLDYYVWGRAKDLVYTEEIFTKEQLTRRINDAFIKIKEEFRVRTTTTEIRKRYRACLRCSGGHFEQYL